MKHLKFLFIPFLILGISSQAQKLQFITDSVIFKSGDGIAISKKIIRTDEHGNQNYYAEYNWNRYDNFWVPATKSEQTIDEYGNQTSSSYFLWNYTDNKWDTASKSTITYTTDNKELSYSYSTYDNINKIWLGDYKYEITYDANGYKTSRIDYDWDDQNNTWFLEEKTVYTTDNNGYVISDLSYDWNLTTLQWELTGKVEYVNAPDGTQIGYTFLSYNKDSQQLIAWLKYSQTFDANNNLTSGIHYDWDNNLNSWKPSSVYRYYYNNKNVEIAREDSAQYGSRKYENTYDENGNILTYMTSTRAANSTTWLQNTKMEWSRDEQNNKVIVTEYYRENNTWIEKTKTEKTFDENKNEICRISCIWNSETNLWDLIQKEDYEYNSYSKQTKGTISNYNSETSMWEVMNIYEYYESLLEVTPTVSSQSITLASEAQSSSTITISTNGEWTVACNTDWLTISPLSGYGNGEITITANNNTATERTTEIIITSDLYSSIKSEYKLSVTVKQSGVTAINNNESPAIGVYPSVVNDELYIKTNEPTTVQIFSSNSEFIAGETVSQNKTISLSQYAPGIYFIKVITKRGITSHSIIIK